MVRAWSRVSAASHSHLWEHSQTLPEETKLPAFSLSTTRNSPGERKPRMQRNLAEELTNIWVICI